MADYRYDKPTVSPVTTWTYWDINVADVQSVKFNFEGSGCRSYIWTQYSGVSFV
ncbi:DUF4465 domain-containing protein [Bacteroides ovatus]|nr:DUF4465 domain-containing protein [Bacteroides ovatus]